MKNLMERISFEYLQEMMNKAEKSSVWTQNPTPTRQGIYLQLQTGLSSQTWFLGVALDEGKMIVERVG